MIYHNLKQPRPDLVKNRHHQIRWKCGDRVSDSGFEKGKKSFKWMIVPILHARGFRTKMIAWNDVASSISRIHHANCKPSTISSIRQLALNSPWILHELSMNFPNFWFQHVPTAPGARHVLGRLQELPDGAASRRARGGWGGADGALRGTRHVAVLTGWVNKKRWKDPPLLNGKSH